MNEIYFLYIYFLFYSKQFKDMKKSFFPPINVSGLKRLTCLKYEL